MINSAFWILTIAYNIGAIFVIRRTISDLRGQLSTTGKDVRRLKVDTHSSVNQSADNAMNILANHGECKANWKKIETIKMGLTEDCKSLHTEACEMYNGQLNYAKREWTKTFGDVIEDQMKFKDQLQERDDAIAQNFSEVYAFIRKCRKENPFLEEALETLPRPRGRPKKKKEKPRSTPSIGAEGWKSSFESTL